MLDHDVFATFRPTQPNTKPDVDVTRLAPGCFAQVSINSTPYWVEITRIDAHSITGKISHSCTQTANSHAGTLIGQATVFCADDITATGCDHLCFC